MAEEKNKYVPLLALAGEWSLMAGMPKEMVLRRLCDWAVAGAFPEGAFVTSTGEKVDPFDIYMSFQATVTELGLVTLGGGTLQSSQWGPHLLSSVLIGVPEARVFCQNLNVIPPPSLQSRFRRLFAQLSGSKPLAPPACPDAKDHAARIEARNSAVSLMNNLRHTLSGLRGKPTSRFSPRRRDNEPIDFQYWGDKWANKRAMAQAAIQRSGEAELQQHLETLDAQWAAFVAADLSARRAAVKTAESESETTDSRGAISQNRELKGPRLQIAKAARRASLDGHSLKLRPRSFDLLLVLAEGGGDALAPVLRRDIEDRLSRNPDKKALSRALYRLRQDLKGSGIHDTTVDTLIENIRAMGYRLTMAGSDIKVDD